MKKIVIASDSFKGCLSSAEVNRAAEEGIRSVYPDCEVVTVPVADGGEGLLDVLLSSLQGQYVTVEVHDPLMNRIACSYGMSGDGHTALIEMARASGLPLVPLEKRNPLFTTSFGTGELIRDALDRGCRDFIVGIGGSATNDGGVGMLQALGFRFLDADRMPVGLGGQALCDIVTIDATGVHPGIKESHFVVACDVKNPFCGPEGAAYVFARQKGADDNMIALLEKGLRSFSDIVRRELGIEIAHIPGAGAAGGMGGGLLAFLHAELKPGIRLLLEALDFNKIIVGADLVITGEGRMDSQTLQGKVPFGVLEEATKQQIPVISIAGSIECADALNKAGFAGVYPIAPGPVSLDQAMEPSFAAANIKRTIMQLLRTIHVFERSQEQGITSE